MAMIRSKGGVVLNKYLVARVFAFDDHESEARAACVAKGWEDVRRGPLWLVPLVKAKNKIDPLYAGTKHIVTRRAGSGARGGRRRRVQAVLSRRLASKTQLRPSARPRTPRSSPPPARARASAAARAARR